MKNRFQRFQRLCLQVLTADESLQKHPKGLLCIPNDNIWNAKKPFLRCNGLQSESKSNPSRELKLSFGRAKVVLLQRKGILLSLRFLLTHPYNLRNLMYINALSPARSKLKNFEQKISLRVQLTVLSDKNANIRDTGKAEFKNYAIILL